MRSAFGIHCFNFPVGNRCCRGVIDRIVMLAIRCYRHRWSQPSPPAKRIAVSSPRDPPPSRSACRYHHSGGWRREGPAIRALRHTIDVCHAIMRHVYGHPGHISINMLQREQAGCDL